nr:hypothetical protein [uncultured Flavobacterium sp.]
MNPSIQINDSHPLAGLLEELTAQVINTATVNDVYLSTDKASPEIIFTVFVDTSYTRIDEGLLELLNRIFENHQSTTCTVFSCDYAADAIRKGNTYFIEHCVLGQLAYTNPDTTTILHPESEQPSVLLPRAKKHFKRAMGKVDGRYTTVPKALKNEKYVDLAYALLQVLEQLFKLAADVVLGKQLFAKDIQEYQTALLSQAPIIAGLFDGQDEEDLRLLAMLYSAYVAFRHKNHLEISRADIEKLLFKTQSLRKEVERLFIEVVARCYEKIKPGLKTVENIEQTYSNTAQPQSSSVDLAKLPRYMMTYDGSYTCKFEFDNYSELFIMIEDLIDISLYTLHNSVEESDFVKHPSRHLVSVLELVRKLLPGDTGQTLTELNECLVAIEKAEKINHTTDE